MATKRELHQHWLLLSMDEVLKALNAAGYEVPPTAKMSIYENRGEVQLRVDWLVGDAGHDAP